MAFTPVATTDTLETFRTRYNATNITLVDDSSTTVDITLATDSLKLSGGTGIASAISGDTVTFNLSNTGVSAASYGSSTAIPVIAVNAQGQITSASTASISTDLTVIDDASTSATISLATDSFKISGGTGTTSAISGDTLTINLDNTAVSAGSYGSGSAIPVITIDAQGRITSASTAAASSDLTIADTSSTTEVITLGSETLKFDGGTGVSASISNGTVSYSFDGTSFTTFVFTATSGQTTFSGNDDNTNTLAYSAGKRNVFLNGVLLDESDFTASNGTSVVLGSGAAANDILTVIAFAVNNIAVLDANGSEFVLDADGDTSITADTDDQIDVKIGGADDFVFKANSFEVQTGSIIDMNGTELVLDADADTSITADTDDQIDFKVGGSDRAEIDSNGLEIKADNGSSTANKLIFHDLDTSIATSQSAGSMEWTQDGGTLGAGTVGKIECIAEGTGGSYTMTFSNGNASGSGSSNFAEHMRIKSDGDIMFNTTDNEPWNNSGTGNTGVAIKTNGRLAATSEDTSPLFINRVVSDGRLVDFLQDGTTEGEITVSGSTVSYNGGHLARWGRLPSGEVDNTILKGTVMSNLDEMVVWSYDDVLYTEEDELPEGKSVGDVKIPAYTAENEQRNQLKVSDVEGDVNVAGLFVSWRNESDDYNDIGLAMTGDMVIRIAQGVTVQKGDLLMSAGDGTAKPQGDDTVKSKTIAKAISNTVIRTYDDNSFLIPCVVMAC